MSHPAIPSKPRFLNLSDFHLSEEDTFDSGGRLTLEYKNATVDNILDLLDNDMFSIEIEGEGIFADADGEHGVGIGIEVVDLG